MRDILTESDLITITNALSVAAENCRDIARRCSSGIVAATFKQSAQQYDALRERIENADTLEVQP